MISTGRCVGSRWRRGLVLVAALLGVAACRHALGARAVVGDLEIRDAYAKEPVIAASGAAYFSVVNHGSRPDTLMAASSPAAAGAMLHGANMGHLDWMVIPAGRTVTLRPGETHLMFRDFAVKPAVGDSLTLVLEFARAGRVTLRIPVRPLVE